MPHVAVDNVQIYYELHGKNDGAVVVFLHGLGSSVRDWELQVERFAAEYRVLLIDMRGHGRSDKPPGPYSVPRFARDVIGVLDHLKIDKAHVVGLSMGGMIAFQLAVDCPERLHSLVIANSGPALVPRSFRDRVGVWTRFAIVRLMGMKKMGETLAGRLFVEPEQETLRQTFVARWQENDPRAYLDAMRALVGWSVEDRIGQITVPTLILASDQDYTPVTAKEAYIAKMPVARLQVIPNAHHAVAVERPEAFNEAVYGFIHAQVGSQV